MKCLFAFSVLALSLSATAAVTRNINGTNYYLLDDFDTADGECVLRGKEYGSTFYSYRDLSPVVKLNADGSVAAILTDKAYPVIEELSCE